MLLKPIVGFTWKERKIEYRHSIGLPANCNNDLEGLEQLTKEKFDAEFGRLAKQVKVMESMQMFLLNKLLTPLTFIIFAQV